MKTKRIGIEAARAGLGDITWDAQYGHSLTVLTRNGKDVAVVVPLNAINHLTRLRAMERLGGQHSLPVEFDGRWSSTGPYLRISVKGESVASGDPGRVLLDASLRWPTPRSAMETADEIAAATDLLRRAVEALRGDGWAVEEDHRTADRMGGVTYNNIRYRIAPPAYVASSAGL